MNNEQSIILDVYCFVKETEGTCLWPTFAWLAELVPPSPSPSPSITEHLHSRLCTQSMATIATMPSTKMGHTATATAPKSDPKDPKGPNVVRAAAYKVPYLVSGWEEARSRRMRGKSTPTRAFPRSRLFKASSQRQAAPPQNRR
ncbi:uncharacterized protein CLUP02_06392 [Colletotrichum lupini]|uniref:Uncharacterized protein n=1 Tax=Colletotrichum lupini TaxID=145971 RepID=A0A9Q8SQ92_9PEZI|nr:uncharacterized protein CLUP02_06392 [Colletotrichum lupini]UQC80906.1 hypothetical protein CLUP02_06392 [Colletotrichum lupini]